MSAAVERPCAERHRRGTGTLPSWGGDMHGRSGSQMQMPAHYSLAWEARATPPLNSHGQFAEKWHFHLLISTQSPPGFQVSHTFFPSPTHAGFTCTHKLDLNPDASQYKSHIRKGKADVQQHLIIPPTLLLRTEPPDALEAIVCSIPSPYAVPKGCLCFLQRDAGNLLLHEGREPHKANK